jgi:hypothetical protein
VHRNILAQTVDRMTPVHESRLNRVWFKKNFASKKIGR